MITIDASLVFDDVPYCAKLDSIPLREVFTDPDFVFSLPSTKELDLLANPFQLSRYARRLSRWSGGRNALNSHQINATMIGGPRVFPSGRRRWWSPDPLERTERCTTAATRRSTAMVNWSIIDIWAGFEYHIFRAIDDLSNVRHVVSAFLPRYSDGVGVDHQVWMDRHVNHHGDAWLDFMQAIECNLRRGLPTVLLSGSDAYMLIGVYASSSSSTGRPFFGFWGYPLEDVPLSSRPIPQRLEFEQNLYINPFDENNREKHRDAMAFVAFEPL